MRGSVGDDANLVALVMHEFRSWNQSARRLELTRQPVHVIGVVVGALAVLALLIVTAAAGKPRSAGMFRARQRAIRNGVAVYVLVAREASGFLQLLFRQYLAADHWLVGIYKRVRHPVVHAEIEIGHDEYRALQLFGQVEGSARHREALGRGTGQKHGMLRISVRQLGDEADVALRGSRRQAGGGSYALNVPNHRRQLDVIAQAGELCHERNSGSSRGGHRACTSPSSAQNHADSGEFILGLDNSKSSFAIRAYAVLLHVINETFDER